MSYLRFSQIIEQVGRNVGIPGNATYDTYLKQWINLAYEDAWRFFLWPQFLFKGSLTLAASKDFIVLPDNVGELVIAYQTRSPYWLEFESSSLIVKRFVGSLEDTASNGLPMFYTDEGEVAVSEQPSSATTLTAVSSSGSDITQTVRIWGEDTNGVTRTDTITLNGLSSVPGAVSLLKIHKISKSDDTVGVITITLTTGGTTVARLGPADNTSRRRRLKLRQLSDLQTTIYFIAKRRQIDLKQDEDVTEFDCSEAIIAGASARAFREQGQFSKAEAQGAIFASNLTQMRSQIIGQSDRRMRITPDLPAGRSRQSRYARWRW